MAMSEFGPLEIVRQRFSRNAIVGLTFCAVKALHCIKSDDEFICSLIKKLAWGLDLELAVWSCIEATEQS